MAHKPPTQSCENCQYMREYTPPRDSECTGYDCLRFPCSLTRDESAGTGQAWHPDMSLNAWCGEWAPANPETVSDAAVTLARFVLLGDLTAARALIDKLVEVCLMFTLLLTATGGGGAASGSIVARPKFWRASAKVS